LKHKNTQPLYIFKREKPQNSEPQNGPRRGLDFIALHKTEDTKKCQNYKKSSIAITQLWMSVKWKKANLK
jgi:hypothetical protein